jgi:hypothetical protein
MRAQDVSAHIVATAKAKISLLSAEIKWEQNSRRSINASNAS